MDIQKFTERAQGFLQAAQTIAIREFNQRLTPEHLLKALLDDEEGAAAGLIRAAGGDPQAAKQAVDAEVARLSKVQGAGAGQPQAGGEHRLDGEGVLEERVAAQVASGPQPVQHT